MAETLTNGVSGGWEGDGCQITGSWENEKREWYRRKREVVSEV